MKRCSILIFSFVLTLLFFVSGCGDKPALGKIEGTVTYNGQPLEKGTIIFAVSGTREATGQIENGEIRNVTTFKEGDGVPIGEASVAIIALKEPKNVSKTAAPETQHAPGQNAPTTGMGGQEFTIPVKYVNPETSGLKTAIQKGVNQVQFDLTK
ncbi:MAG: hypothetical protein LBT05_12970 [Planctomycetaceae bacterium]|jgi:hypothetical protein|nr:hypothetical protein [Planctomycetaceae bacterium]